MVGRQQWQEGNILLVICPSVNPSPGIRAYAPALLLPLYAAWWPAGTRAQNPPFQCRTHPTNYSSAVLRAFGDPCARRPTFSPIKSSCEKDQVDDCSTLCIGKALRSLFFEWPPAYGLTSVFSSSK